MCIKNYVSHQRAMFRENILLAENLISMLGESAIKTVARPGGCLMATHHLVRDNVLVVYHGNTSCLFYI